MNPMKEKIVYCETLRGVVVRLARGQHSTRRPRKLENRLITALVDIERHSQLEDHEAYFRNTMVIFGNFSFKITVFLDENLEKMTFVSSQKMLKINRTPAFYIHQYGIT